MRVGVIDVGSNTIHLLVADTDGAGVRALEDPSRALFLGQDIATIGAISPKRLNAAIRTTAAFAQRARLLGAQRVLVLATEAVRRAANSAEVGAAFAAAGVELLPITPRREGELSALGASLDMPSAQDMVVADIGGASCQLSRLAGGHCVDVVSLPLGSGTLAVTLDSDPPRPSRIARIAARAGAGLAAALPPAYRQGQALVAVGGTVRRLARVAGAPPPSLVRRDAAERALDTVLSVPAPEGARRLSLDAPKMGTLRAGGLVALALLEHLGLEQFLVSACGIREGAALMLGRGGDPARDSLA